MARGAAVVLFLAVAALIMSVWLRDRPLPEGVPPRAVLERFEKEAAPVREVELALGELLDPKLALPTWHRHPRGEAAAVAKAMKTCPVPAVDVHDPSLAKAYEFAKARCEKADLRRFAATPPFMHPSGKSYAALSHGPRDTMHVIERADLGLEPHDWLAIARGERLLLASNALVLVESGERDKRLIYYDRGAWEDATRAANVSLVPRAPGAFCASPASPSFCYRRLDPRRRWLGGVTIGASIVAALSGAMLAFAFVRERRRASADRVHVFRTLTHELRTPAQSLGNDVDLLQSSYDALPADAQESVLRISEGVARLNRVLHRSTRFLQLFDGARSVVKRERVASARHLMEELASEWPEGVELTGAEDGAITTDPEWLSVALRNLVENGFRHGKPPVRVTWRIEDETFVLTVSDAGTSPKRLLRHAAYHRSAKSQGLGLGLAIVQRITSHLGGKLTHHPSPTTWTLRLPRGEA